MFFRVFRTGHYVKVFWSVVEYVTIFMMNMVITHCIESILCYCCESVYQYVVLYAFFDYLYPLISIHSKPVVWRLFMVCFASLYSKLIHPSSYSRAVDTTFVCYLTL